MGIRFKYTLKFMIGFLVTTGIVYLGYWLVMDYKVTNIFALIGIGLFIVVPSIKVLLMLPTEVHLLYLVWVSDEPESIEKMAEALRLRGQL